MNQDRIEQWKRLLSDERLGEIPSYTHPEGRSRFDQDYDRIVFSSAFRRLQDKTQVFPLSQSDYTRTVCRFVSLVKSYQNLRKWQEDMTIPARFLLHPMSRNKVNSGSIILPHALEA